jgi:hypothetical protein
LTLKTADTDAEGRTFYKDAMVHSGRTLTRNEVVVFGPDLEQAIPHKTMYPVLAKVVSITGVPSVRPGDLVVLMMTGFSRGVDSLAGVASTNGLCATIYRIPQNPMILARENIVLRGVSA